MTEGSKAGFFRDDKGQPSSGRLMSAASLAAAIVIAVSTTWSPNNVCDELAKTYVMWFVVGAFGGKGVQKYMEVKK